MIAENPRRGVRITQIPPYKTWLADKPEVKTLKRKARRRLYNVVSMKDSTLIRVNGELRRFSRVAMVDVYYHTRDKTYKLHETRTEIKRFRNSERQLRRIKEGDMNGVIVEQDRENGNSISERSKLNGETREEATVRAIKEELFSHALETSDEVYPDLEEIIAKNIVPHEQRVHKRGPQTLGNTLKGIPATYFLMPAEITFTPDMHVPIGVVDGVPQPLYEKEEGKYINIFTWIPVEK